MFMKKDIKYYQKKKPFKTSQTYSQSETSFGWSTWENANDRKGRNVAFDEEYNRLSHDVFHGGRARNENSYSYPHLYDSSDIYETGYEIDDYYTDDSQYTRHYLPPQQITYKGTDFAYTTEDSDHVQSTIDYGYKNNYSHSYKKRDDIHSKINDSGIRRFGGDLSVYFARQPSSRHIFRNKDMIKYDMINQTEPQVQGESVTDTEKESKYHTVNTGKNLGYPNQVYTAQVGKNEAFKKPLENDKQEKLISITEYDNMPVLAFKTKSVSKQKSKSGLVYFPVVFMENEEKNPSYKTAYNHLDSCKNCQTTGTPIKVYTQLNTGQKNPFNKTSVKNTNQETQCYLKNNGNKQNKTTVFKNDNYKSSPINIPNSITQKSYSKPRLNQSKTTLYYLPSILPEAKNYELIINTALPTSEQNHLNQNQTNKNKSNISVASRKSNSKAENIKNRPENKSKSTREKEKVASSIKSKISSVFGKNEDKKYVSITKSNTSNVSKNSLKSPQVLPQSKNHKKSGNKKQSQKLLASPLIAESLPGVERGSALNQKAQQRELEARKQEIIRKSNLTKVKQDEGGKQNKSTLSEKPEGFGLTMTEINQGNNTTIESAAANTSEIVTQSKITPSDQLNWGLTDIKTDGPQYLPVNKQNQMYDTQKELLRSTLKIDQTKNTKKKSTVTSTVNPPQHSIIELEIKEINDKNYFKNDTGENNKSFTSTLLRKSQIYDNRIIDNVNDDTKKISVKEMSVTAEGKKSIGQIKNQTNENQSKERENSVNRNVLSETTHAKNKYSLVTPARSLEDERRNQIVELPKSLSEEKNLKSHFTTVTTNTDMNQILKAEREKTKVNQKLVKEHGDETKQNLSYTEVNNHPHRLSGEEKSKVRPESEFQQNIGLSKRKSLSSMESLMKIERNQNIDQRYSIQERQGSKISEKTKQHNISKDDDSLVYNEEDSSNIMLKKTASTSPKGKDKETVKGSTNLMLQKTVSTDLKDKDKEMGKSSTKLMLRKTASNDPKDKEIGKSCTNLMLKKTDSTDPKDKERGKGSNICLSQETPSVSNFQTKSKSKTHKIETSGEKTDIEHFCDHPIKIWGWDCSNLILCCFQITQFILGVSTFEKFIQVLGNYH